MAEGLGRTEFTGEELAWLADYRARPRAYVPGYSKRAAAALETFLGMPVGQND